MTGHSDARMALKSRLGALAQRFAPDQSGATALEYALVGALTSVSIIAGLTLYGATMNASWNWIANVVSTALSH
jgi:pilus assembly protein Flp/PilA